MKTVLARIAVAVDANGVWGCAGWHTINSDEEYDVQAMALACENVDPGEKRYWIEVNLTLPEPETIVAGAVPAA